MNAYDPRKMTMTMNGILLTSPNEWSDRSPLSILKRIATVGGVSLDEVRASIEEHENYTSRRMPGCTVAKEVNDAAKIRGVWVFWLVNSIGFKEAKAAVCGKVWRVGSPAWIREEARKADVTILCELKVPCLWPHGEVTP